MTPALTCATSANTGETITACQQRCDGVGSQGQIAACEGAVFKALGIDGTSADLPKEEMLVNQLSPSSAQGIVEELLTQCGAFAYNSLTLTCGMASSNPALELADLVTCLLGSVESTETCLNVPDLQGRFFTVSQLNGCPEFAPDGGAPDSGTNSSSPPVLPINGGFEPAIAFIAPSSVVSVSGSDIATVSIQPTGTISAYA